MDSAPLFQQLSLSGWRQFRDIEIDFHDKLTILTGANGAGKSTILKILKCHFPYESDEQFLATPVQEGGRTSFSIGGWFSTQLDQLFPRKKKTTDNEIGRIIYSNGTDCALTIPQSDTMSYSLKRSVSVSIQGISISSHRLTPRYDEVKNISISGMKPIDAYKDFFDVQKSYVDQLNYFKDGVHRRVNPVGAMKEAIISFATFGVGNRFVSPIPELVGWYERFQQILHNVLPREIGFQSLEIRTPEVVVVSNSGHFPIDGASGGLMSIIQLSWQIFLQSEIHKSSRYMILIDEPENHLHPSMQKSFLSNIVKAFPKARFVVATHSPFIISSVKDSYVYALRHYTSDATNLHMVGPRSVNSEKLDQLRKAGPANDMLREVLGVPVTLPDWSAAELEEIAAEFAGKEVNSSSLQTLRTRLENAGLGEFYPSAIEKIVR